VKGGGIEIKDKQVRILTEINKVKHRWKEYVEELYRSEDNGRTDDDVEEEIWEREEDIGPEVLGEEVRAAIKELKNNKAEGIDYYTSRDAQKPGGGCNERTDRDMPRHIYIGSMAGGLPTINYHTN